jgi:ribonuclease P protein component
LLLPICFLPTLGALIIFFIAFGSRSSHHRHPLQDRGEKIFMKFSSSLKKNHIFRRLYASKGIANSYLVLYARPNRSGHNYIGITVSKKLGHAVVRNRTRRRIREVYRIHEDRFTSGWDIVVLARTRSVNADFGDLTHAYLSLAQKAGLLRPLPESEVTP